MANPHLSAGRLLYGAPLADATLVVVAVHGRGQSPEYLVENLIKPLDRRDFSCTNTAWVLPAADGGTWYPLGFMAPIADNQPRLGYALDVMVDIASELTEGSSPRSPSQIVWAGFSQGAVLVTEHIARRPRRWAGLICLTGGMIGPADNELRVAGPLSEMPAYFSNSGVDEWVPLSRTEASAEAFRAAGADVEFEIIPDRPHLISPTEIDSVARFLRRVAG